MNLVRPAALGPDRLAALLPLLVGALVFAGLAMPGKLLPVKPLPIEIPAVADTAPGAAPQESVPPPLPALAFSRPSPVLPRDSVPDEAAPTYATPSVAMAPPGGEAAVPADHLPLATGGSGNLALRATHAHAVSSLALNLLQQVERIRASARAAAHASRKPAPLPKPGLHASVRRAPPLPAPAKAGPPVASLGGAAPPANGLGGPAAMAESLNGATMRRKF
jgi:hypothetical protein